ncbi:MAG: alpha/beta fold hydrolase [Myxococcota bacterium]|nr:alpha/beta fold hydrolase [Myxococcota bacterium]
MAAIAVAMPRLGMTMEEGTVVEWPVPVGGRVEKGETLLIIETEKAESEIEATLSGTLRHVYAEPGETLRCGVLLAAITEEADEAFDADVFAAEYVPPDGPIIETAIEGPRQDAVAPVRPPPGERKPVAPAARALAKKHGVEIDLVSGTGPNGRVTKQDVERWLAAREALTPVEAGVRLEVLREGAGDPVVLLPGFGTDVSSFALQTPILAPDFEVIGVNPRGVGASDAPDLEAYEVGRAAEDVAAVLEAPAHVIGASLGAAVALELALSHPDRVRSLSLITPFLEASPRLAAVSEAWVRLAGEASPDTLAAFLAPWLFGEKMLADEKARARTLRGLASSVPRSPAVTLARTRAGLVAWSGSRGPDLGEIRVPTLVLLAGDDLLTPNGAAVAAAIPEAKCESIEGCGHALAIDGAEVVNRLLREHLG